MVTLAKSNQEIATEILNHQFVSTLLLIIGIIIIMLAIIIILTSAFKSFKRAKEKEENIWEAIAAEIIAGIVVVVIALIAVNIPMKTYVEFTTPAIKGLLEFLLFIWNLLPWT